MNKKSSEKNNFLFSRFQSLTETKISNITFQFDKKMFQWGEIWLNLFVSEYEFSTNTLEQSKMKNQTTYKINSTIHVCLPWNFFIVIPIHGCDSSNSKMNEYHRFTCSLFFILCFRVYSFSFYYYLHTSFLFMIFYCLIWQFEVDKFFSEVQSIVKKYLIRDFEVVKFVR